MNEENRSLQEHIKKGIEKIITDVMKAAWKDPKESAFLARFALACKKAAGTRQKAEERGDHVPGFLIASITSRCNLHCAGCYSRCIETTTDAEPVCQLSGEDWLRIFLEAQDLGVSFILLAGGEPLLRRDVLKSASTVKQIMFPIFTNGTCLNEEYLDLFDRCRNLVPVLSIEGNRETTDKRRGDGIYDTVSGVMERLQKLHLLYGTSITVTTENIREVTSQEFVKTLLRKGCKLILYIEFVPVIETEKFLAPQDPERRYLEQQMNSLRREYPDVLLLSFPGDELAMGGCMAAGREFFHINSHGGAEPCPFSPYSDVNVREHSLKEALHSNLFQGIRTEGLLKEEHAGGCVLYDKRKQVEALLNGD